MADLSHRKAEAKVQVKGADGKVLANQKVHINQVNHEFLFGCGAFETLPYTNGTPDATQEDRMQKWLGLFNYGTLPFYWGGFEPEEGSPHTEQLMAAAKFLKSKDVTVKGHPLCWHTGCVPWLMNYDNKTILEKHPGARRRR